MNEDEQKYPLSYTETLEFAAETLVRACKEAMRKVHKEMNFEISHEEHIILETIALNPGIIQLDIAKKLFMQRSYVCKLLTKFEKSGWIRKEAAIKGSKKTIMKIYCTEKGTEACSEVRKWIKSVIAKKSPERLLKARKTTDYLLQLTKELKERYKLRL